MTFTRACRKVRSGAAAALVVGLSVTGVEPPATDALPHRRPVAVVTPGARADVGVRPAMVQLPPPPAGVRDFALPDLFRRPIGPAGLEYSERARELGGQCVRVSGYIVEGRAATNGFLLASAPVELHDDEDGLCDDLPANTVAVLVPAAALAGVVLPLHTPVLVTGKLELTTTEDPGGRRLFARVTVDDTMSTFVTPLATVLRSSTPSRLEAAPVPATTTITDLEGSHASR